MSITCFSAPTSRRYIPENATCSGERAMSSKKLRNVMVAGRRTSMRLEPAFWDALEEIAQREDLTVSRL
ncbi:ribbon-helix-helix domain-containing protein, partial [Azospirillum sp. TSH58]|uniref:ribbon-helix-helix domain-containing protein n=1 Tax=Azospirillum sp. TSH58 TaxID=664962 RepID=UPI0032B8343D